ncbi:hypothetical protein CPC08DRAFT_400438 [Agrocybe pediades]|nr:hypothetical protein CPC08DRAFT_400438 [Agrocybe pediades]
MALSYPGSSRQKASVPVGVTEFEILKASHKFLREEDEKPTTWDEQLAGKYYSNLYREFAVCDLKHYKSGNFALRWRTEEEVLDGSGETTCGNTRCKYHFPPRFPNKQDMPPLATLELPFAYVEQGEAKSALVKVVLCGKCVKKLMWKRTQEKEKERSTSAAQQDSREEQPSGSSHLPDRGEESDSEKRRRKKRSRDDKEDGEKSSRRRRSSRSKSPRRSR